MSTAETPDRLSSVFERFRMHARLFHAGPLCGVTRFAAEPGRAFLHVLRRGVMTVNHADSAGRQQSIELSTPTLLFYPRPLAHVFHNPPVDGSDFVCASVSFDGGEDHLIARALPAIVILPIAEVTGLEHTLALLFSESERALCGQRLLLERLFEVLVLQLLRWLLDHPDRVGMPAGLLSGLAHPKLARALSAMHAHPSQDWRLQTMAREAGMSRSAFALAFRQALNTTPADYLLDLRVRIAQTLLRQGQSIKLAADQVGYGNASSLSRAFQLALGCSPRVWLKAQRL